jgi:glycosyltransferase involved in cell wall biosynthesis
MSKLKILIGGADSKFFHLKEFGEALARNGVEYELVNDVNTYDGFPSRKISNWFQNKKKFNSIVKEFNPDAVFIDRQGHFGIAALKSKLPLLVHLRGDYWSEMKWAKETLYKDPVKRNVLWFKNRLAKKCFKESTLILPICNYLNEIVDKKYPGKSKTFYQGIDPKRWYQEQGMQLKHPCVGLLQGATIWGKAQEMLILEKVLQKFPNVTFYWAGDGPYRNNILSKLNKYDNFEWLGALEYPDKVREYLSEIDIYALISGIDMSPLTLQEAQLMQKPVIATNVGGIPELMNDKITGFLIDKGNTDQLEEKIEILLNDNQKSKSMGVEGRKFVKEKFEWDVIAKGFLESSKDFLNI